MTHFVYYGVGYFQIYGFWFFANHLDVIALTKEYNANKLFIFN